MKLPRRHPRSVYAVCDAEEELADGALAADRLEEFPGAFDRAAEVSGQDTVPIDPVPGAVARPHRPASRRAIACVLAGVGAASAIAAAAIALLALTSGGALTHARLDVHKPAAVGARVRERRALRIAASPHASMGTRTALGAARRRGDRRAVPTLGAAVASAAAAASWTSAAAGRRAFTRAEVPVAPAPAPISPSERRLPCGCSIAELEFGFER